MSQELVPVEEQGESNLSLKIVGINILISVMSNLITALLLSGAVWIAQRLWGLRLIPFNVLDAILLSLVIVVAILALLSTLLWWWIGRLIMKVNPGALLGMFLGAILFNYLLSKVDLAKVAKSMNDKKDGEE